MPEYRRLHGNLLDQGETCYTNSIAPLAGHMGIRVHMRAPCNAAISACIVCPAALKSDSVIQFDWLQS